MTHEIGVRLDLGRKGGVETSLCTISGGHTYGDANLGWAMMKRHALP